MRAYIIILALANILVTTSLAFKSLNRVDSGHKNEALIKSKIEKNCTKQKSCAYSMDIRVGTSKTSQHSSACRDCSLFDESVEHESLEGRHRSKEPSLRQRSLSVPKRTYLRVNFKTCTVHSHTNNF